MVENKFVAWLRTLSPIEMFTAVLCFFTAVLCVVGYLQYSAFVQSESAFVFPTALEFTEPLGVEKRQPILLDMDIANSGKSAATISELLAFVGHDLPDRPNYDQPGPNRIRIGIAPVPAAGKIRQSLQFSDWSQDTTTAVKSGGMAFYLWGELTYKDEARHFTESISDFCFTYFASKQDASKSVFRTCSNPDFTRTRTRKVW
jgi:hypothetical protein